MKIVYVILKDGRYVEVTKEEYDNFDGEKFWASPWWRFDIAHTLLIQLRY